MHDMKLKMAFHVYLYVFNKDVPSLINIETVLIPLLKQASSYFTKIKQCVCMYVCIYINFYFVCF